MRHARYWIRLRWKPGNCYVGARFYRVGKGLMGVLWRVNLNLVPCVTVVIGREWVIRS